MKEESQGEIPVNYLLNFTIHVDLVIPYVVK